MPKRYDEQLALAIASGLSVDQAAVKLGISRTAAFRRWRDPAVKQRAAQLRQEMTDRVLGALTENLLEAVTTLKQLMRVGETDSVRLKAASQLLETGLKAVALTQLEQRIVELETAMKGNQCLTT